MKAPLIWIGVGVLIGVAVLYVFFWPSLEEREVITYRTETKTEWIRRDTTYIHLKDSLVIREVITEREPSPEPDKYDSIRTYTGFEPHQYGQINWKIKTGGYLHYLEINPVLDLPIETITNTIEKTRTVIVRPGGLYATGAINDALKPSIGAIYLKDKAMIGYRYNFYLKNHEAMFGYKVF